MTVTVGLRMEYERGATERYNRAISYFDPKLELPISAAAQAAYARNPMPELPVSQFVVKRWIGLHRARTAVPRELWRSELMWLPEFRRLGRLYDENWWCVADTARITTR